MTLQPAYKPALVFPLQVKAVAIDLDGTLLHTAPDLAEAANRMLAELHKPAVAEQQVMAYIGHGAAKLVERLLAGEMEPEKNTPGKAAHAATFEIAMPIFLRHYAETLSLRTQPYPGAMQGLDSLANSGFRLACVTNKPERFTLPLLKAMGMLEYFELVLSGDSLPRKKPDAMPLLHVCKQFGVQASELVMIGDSAADTQAANAAACYAFYVDYGYNGGMQAHQLQVDAVLSSLADADALLARKD